MRASLPYRPANNFWVNNYQATNFRIETSNDADTNPTNWTQRWATPTSPGGATVDATFPAVSARHVRISCTSGANSSNYRLYEMEVYP